MSKLSFKSRHKMCVDFLCRLETRNLQSCSSLKSLEEQFCFFFFKRRAPRLFDNRKSADQERNHKINQGPLKVDNLSAEFRVKFYVDWLLSKELEREHSMFFAFTRIPALDTCLSQLIQLYKKDGRRSK